MIRYWIDHALPSCSISKTIRPWDTWATDWQDSLPRQGGVVMEILAPLERLPECGRMP
jgi:hypothetical protein